MLEVRDLVRTYGKVCAVDRLSFAMPRGQVWGFIGPNGAGKTTTMRIAATLDLPDSGDAVVDGMSALVEPREVRRRVGFMADQFAPYPNLTVRPYLDFFARAYGLSGRRRVRTVDAVVGFCGLQEFEARPTTGLSKGMGQRLHLAKTLLHDPKLLILDEPTAGLDPRARIEFRSLLGELAAAGKSVLISSHILSELQEACDGVVVLERGRIVVAGSIAEVARGLRAHRTVRVRLLGPGEAAEQFFLTQPSVERVSTAGSEVAFDYTGDDDGLATMLGRALAQGLRVVEFRLEAANLEDIFLQMTKGRLQ
ncbi:MAG: ABC transporter ATP-binding protein [Planctomycetota bacterium]